MKKVPNPANSALAGIQQFDTKMYFVHSRNQKRPCLRMGLGPEGFVTALLSFSVIICFSILEYSYKLISFYLIAQSALQNQYWFFLIMAMFKKL